MASAHQQQPILPGQAADPLAELRDIHQPEMISAWPPAVGWWLLALLLGLALMATCVWLFRRWRVNRYRREALRELKILQDAWQEDQDDHAYLEALQRLLKRVALTGFPRENVASLTGEAWLQFLDLSTGSHDYSMGQAEALIEGNYRKDAAIDVAALQQAAKQWIHKHDMKHLTEEAA